MKIKKMMKKVFIIIFFATIFILLNHCSSQADETTIPSTGEGIIGSAVAEDKTQYFDMDPEGLINKYNQYSGESLGLTGNEENYQDSSVYCLGDIQGGNGNDWRVSGNIDVDGEGNVTVYGCDPTTGKATKATVTDETEKKYFNVLAYLYVLARDNKEGITFDYVQYYWHLRLASNNNSSSILSKYKISTKYIPKVVTMGQIWGLDNEINKIEAMYEDGLITAQKGNKTRMTYFNIEDGQQRIVGATAKDEGVTITITKKDADTGDPVKGAVFSFYEDKTLRASGLKTDSKGKITVKNSKGNIVINHKNGKDTVVIEGKQLTVGKEYTFTETAAPKGYKMPKDNSQTRKLTENKLDFTMTNKLKFPRILITKIDKDTGKKLPGAEFKISKGNKVLATGTTGSDGTWVSKAGIFEIGKTYKIEETKAPTAYAKLADPIYVKITRGKDKPQVCAVTVSNTAKYVRLKIVKIDGETRYPLSGASFRVLDENGVEKDSGTTGIDGTWTSGYVCEIGKTYTIEETDAPPGYAKIRQPITKKITKDDKEELICVQTISNNPAAEGLLKIIKDTDDVPVSGIKFGLKNWEPDRSWYKYRPTRPDAPQRPTLEPEDENYEEAMAEYNAKYSQYLDDLQEYYVWKSAYDYYIRSQTEYVVTGVSDSDGIVAFTGFRKDGSYSVYEYGSDNPYFQEVNDSTGPKLIMKGYRYTTKKTIENERTYVDIEGTVFVQERNGKQSTTDNEYAEKKGFNGVKVTLKKGRQVVANVSSGYDSNGSSTGTGHYKFWGDVNHLKIEADKLSQYTIEFEYNGLKYESLLETSIAPGDSSKAKENESERQEFNTRYSQVTAETKISGGQSTNKALRGDSIRYKSEPHTSEVIYQTTAVDDNGNPYDKEGYADDQYHIKAYTSEAGLNLSQTGRQGGYPYDPSKNEIKDINFVMLEREAPDVAISSDLVSAETSINGYSQIYKYQKRYDVTSESAFTVETKASDVTSYQRNLYKSEVNYTEQTRDGSELAVYLTYVVAIKNQSSSINVTVKDIVNYFTPDVTEGIMAVGAKIEEQETIPAKSNENRYKIIGGQSGEGNGNGEGKITLNKELGVGETYKFYVQYKMTPEAICKTLGGNVKFENVFELNTVSAKSNKGKIWTAVDKDSAVGNCVFGNKETMEDDTDFAPGINIIVTDNRREITGAIFEDYTNPEFKTGEERKGDGEYGTGDKGITGVKAELIDIDREGRTAYSNTGGASTTSSNGNYTLNGFIPGNYIIKYTYGNGTEKYTAQQYKSTIYVDQNRAEKYYVKYNGDNGNEETKYWYLSETDRKSDAVDNYNGEIQTLYGISGANSRTNIEKAWNESDGLQHFYHNTSINSSLEIDAFTPHFGIPVEKAGAKEGDYIVSNIDFGIVERPRYKVQLNKEIARIQLVQPDGSILRDFTNFKDLPANTKAVQRTEGSSKGFVQFEIDTELLQTITLLIEYKFKVTNISELEYQDEAYYKYGTPTNNSSIVKLSVAGIADYVDNELKYTESTHMITEGNTGRTNKSNGWVEIKDQKENKKYVTKDVLDSLYDKDGKCEYDTILRCTGLSNSKIAPKETSTISLLLNKTLAPTEDEMHYDNTAEIVEVTKPWGRELYNEDGVYGQQLGNLDPTIDESEIVKQIKDPDTNYSEKIIINPPTGTSAKSIIGYTIIGIASLAILAIGIVIIKKKILD